ncbi:hypothetical protein KPH14_001819 [Odynerus spinipes]|uniref:NADH dehydrogenase [ubiquinone] 1 beta subcomplex subunit 5, mitochondrial n=1 Tax=Odynerus spinipes TaxID=1348599 RepID=A0AAD9RZV6_9HYME|nr:hypothetical protein KPH14_001819 [Odynerus spinipes]
MAAWSSILRSANQKLNGLTVLLFKKSPVNNQIRCMSEHRVMNIQGSRWQWDKTKDMLHFYFMLGIIPSLIVVFCSYVFVGPATLEPIPEGYVPKHWEYYRNPITRFMARYINNSPQQEYEKYLNVLYLENECMKTRMLQKRIEDLINERHDYRYFIHTPVSAKFLYQARQLAEQRNRM